MKFGYEEGIIVLFPLLIIFMAFILYDRAYELTTRPPSRFYGLALFVYMIRITLLCMLIVFYVLYVIEYYKLRHNRK